MTEFINTYADYIIGITFLIIFHLAAYLILTLETTCRRNQKELDEMMGDSNRKLSEVYRHNWRKTND